MKRLCAFVILTTLILTGEVTTVFAQAAKLCSIADSAIASASAIRGLRQRRDVPCLLHNKEEVKEYLRTTIDTKIPAEKLRGEEEMLKALGFIPQNFDYKKGIVDLYLSQLGGYYDPDQKHYVMAAWLPSAFQAPIAVHELTHALQDQYYDLGKMVHDPNIANDTLLARSALAEGDATAVMMDYTRKLTGQASLREEKNVQSIMMQNVIGGALAVGTDVPQTLQLMLLFPYTSGIRFAHQLLLKGGYPAIDAAFKDPPTTTEEILHPEKYIDRSKNEFRIYDSADVVWAGVSEQYHDVIGEFPTVLLLAELSGEKLRASDAAAGWGGDRASILSENGSRWVVWRSSWDTDKDCDEFLSLFTAGLKKRHGAAVAVHSKLQLQPSDRPVLMREGREVLYIAPLPSLN